MRATVEAALADIERRGDEAVREMSVRFDRWDREDFRLSPAEIERCLAQLGEQALADIRFAQAQVRNFAEIQRAALHDVEVETLPGVVLGHKNIPVSSVGCYVPGGKYPLLASAHMSIVTAKVAGVGRIVTCAPPYQGQPAPAIVAAQHLAGRGRDLRAWAASRRSVRWRSAPRASRRSTCWWGRATPIVAEAKRQLFGRVGIDLLAGPTETLVIADETVDGEICAVDLLGQAEHGPTSPAVLLTVSGAARARDDRRGRAPARAMPTGEVAGQAWRDYGQVIVAEDYEEMLQIADEIASEHVQVMTDRDD